MEDSSLPATDLHSDSGSRATVDMEASDEENHLAGCLDRLAAAEPGARDELIAIACVRMRGLAHRMLRRFPSVRRWDETDDIVQNAAIRLHRALGEVLPADERSFMGLAAVQVRRELLDLAKKHAGPGSYASNHETNYRHIDGEARAKVDDAPAAGESRERISRWSHLHDAAASLPDEERELFHLVWYLGLKQNDAATVLGCSLRTVKRRWEEAKRLLAAAMPEGVPD